MKFIDKVEFELSSGNGGPGCISFRREKYLPRGGPDGGNGGRGGHVIFRTNTSKTTLLDFQFRKKMAAGNGKPGEGSNCTGADGADLIIEVPPGTILKDLNTGQMIDIPEDGDFQFLTGGRGGKGNWHFKTSVNQTPDYSQPGEEGQETRVSLELKLIADVGLLGFPNVGKSTLISRISAAKPKIADYPFTTLAPNLGVVDLGDGNQFVVADIPGIIEGAHEGVGLGIQFLKHIERTRFFVHVIDCSGMTGREPEDDFIKINEELKKYDDLSRDSLGGKLSTRKQIIALNKIDTISVDDQEYFKTLFAKQTDFEIVAISAVSGQGIDELMKILSREILSKGDSNDG